MDAFRQLRVSLGCTDGPWGTRDRAYANRNTVLIHHPVSSEVIKSNYSRPPHSHLNLPPDGDPAEQQVALSSYEPKSHHCHLTP